MKKAISALHFLAVVSFGSSSVAAKPIMLEPSSKWVLDYANDTCRLIRVFGTGSNEVKAVFDQISPRSQTSLTLIGPGVRAMSGTSGHVLALDPSGWRVLHGQVWMAKNSGTKALVWGDLQIYPPDPKVLAEAEKERREAERTHRQKPMKRPEARSLADKETRVASSRSRSKAVEMLQVDPGGSTAFALHSGPLEAPLEALEQCAHDSLVDWGIDPAVYDKIVRPAWATNMFLGPADYPELARRIGKEADVKARLNIDAEGQVTKCTVTSNVDAREFSSAVCSALQRRGRYEPAELADGTKVPDYVVIPVSFRMEDYTY